MREEAEDAEPMTDRDDDNAALRHALAIVAWLGAIAGNEAATVDVEEDGQLSRAARLGHPDVEVQTILAHARVAKHHVTEDTRLHALVGESVSSSNSLPVGCRLRRPPPEIAHRRRAIRNSPEGADATRQDDSRDCAVDRAGARRACIGCTGALRTGSSDGCQ